MAERPAPEKSADAFRTIGEVADELKLPQHVLRFWETRFPHVKPLKRAGGRRFYRPDDVAVLRAIKALLYGEGYTIKGVQRLLQEQGARDVAAAFAASAGPGTAPAAPEVAAHRGGTTAMARGQTDAEDRPARPPGTDRTTVGHDAALRRAASPRRGPGVSDDAAARLEEVLDDIVECTRLLIASRTVGDA